MINLNLYKTGNGTMQFWGEDMLTLFYGDENLFYLDFSGKFYYFFPLAIILRDHYIFLKNRQNGR